MATHFVGGKSVDRQFQILVSIVSLVAIICAAWIHRSFFAQSAHAAQFNNVSTENQTTWTTPNGHSAPTLIETFGSADIPDDFLTVERNGEFKFDDDRRNPFPFTTKSSKPTPAAPPAINEQYRPFIPFREQSSIPPSRESQGTIQPQHSNEQRVSAHVRTEETFNYQTQPSDSLQSIALRYMGSSERYLELYAINKDRLSNPVVIPAGTVLIVPRPRNVREADYTASSTNRSPSEVAITKEFD